MEIHYGPGRERVLEIPSDLVPRDFRSLAALIAKQQTCRAGKYIKIGCLFRPMTIIPASGMTSETFLVATVPRVRPGITLNIFLPRLRNGTRMSRNPEYYHF